MTISATRPQPDTDWDDAASMAFFRESVPHSLMTFGVLWSLVGLVDFRTTRIYYWAGVTSGFLLFLFGFMLEDCGIFTAIMWTSIFVVGIGFGTLNIMGGLPGRVIAPAILAILVCWPLKGFDQPIKYIEPPSAPLSINGLMSDDSWLAWRCESLNGQPMGSRKARLSEEDLKRPYEERRIIWFWYYAAERMSEDSGFRHEMELFYHYGDAYQKAHWPPWVEAPSIVEDS